jgi:hypothetical protein
MKKLACALLMFAALGMRPASANLCFVGTCFFALSQDSAWEPLPPPGHHLYGNGPGIYLSTREGWDNEGQADAFATQLATNEGFLYDIVGNIGGFGSPGIFQSDAEDLMVQDKSYYFTGFCVGSIPI